MCAESCKGLSVFAGPCQLCGNSGGRLVEVDDASAAGGREGGKGGRERESERERQRGIDTEAMTFTMKVKHENRGTAHQTDLRTLRALRGAAPLRGG